MSKIQRVASFSQPKLDNAVLTNKMQSSFLISYRKEMCCQWVLSRFHIKSSSVLLQQNFFYSALLKSYSNVPTTLSQLIWFVEHRGPHGSFTAFVLFHTICFLQWFLSIKPPDTSYYCVPFISSLPSFYLTALHSAPACYMLLMLISPGLARLRKSSRQLLPPVPNDREIPFSGLALNCWNGKKSRNSQTL